MKIKLLALLMALVCVTAFASCTGETGSDGADTTVASGADGNGDDNGNENNGGSTAFVPERSLVESDLIGFWRCTDKTIAGDYFPADVDMIFLSDYDIGFTYEGKAFGEFFANFFSLEAAMNIASPACKAETKDGTIVLPGVTLAGAEVSLSYTLGTVRESEFYNLAFEGFSDYFAKVENNQLTLHITGKYTDAQGEKAIDATFIYEKEIEQAAVNSQIMNGKWVDGDGTTWEITWNGKDACTFKAVTSAAQTMTGDMEFSRMVDAQEGIRPSVSFHVTGDSAGRIDARFKSITSDKIVMILENETETTFTRTK